MAVYQWSNTLFKQIIINLTKILVVFFLMRKFVIKTLDGDQTLESIKI